MPSRLPFERVFLAYIADDGGVYNVKLPFYYVGKLHRQWDAYDPIPWFPLLPVGMRMRTIHLKNADGSRRRQWPCSRVETGYWPFLGQDIVLPSIDGTATTWHVVGYSEQSFQPNKFRGGRRR